MLATLQRLSAAMAVEDVAALPPRMRALARRLEQAGHAARVEYQGRTLLALTATARRMVPAAAARTPTRAITRAHLDALGLTAVSPFQVAALPKPIGRPSVPGPRIYLKELPSWDWDPREDLDETALALLVFEPRACGALVRANPRRQWKQLRQRIHAEDLGRRARYFGISKLIALRLPKRGRATRHDAYRRAKTEPVPDRRPRR